MTKLFNLIDYKILKPCGELTKRSRLFTGYGCNIKCKFCFYRNEKHKDIKHLIYQQLEQGKRYGILDWDISGGEPSILPYWVDLLKDMKDMGFRNIACITNGYKFAGTDFLLKSINAGMNEILFSVHGSCASVHDFMTGVEGSFQMLELALGNAFQFKDSLKVRINIVVTKDNVNDLEKIIRFVYKIGYPVAINFLPYRVENSADKKESIRFSDMNKQINRAILIGEAFNHTSKEKTKFTIRYAPVCMHRYFEKYVAGYLQRVFDEYEWDEYTIRKFENARFNKDIPELDCKTDKWKLQIDALDKSIRHVAGHPISCLKCRYVKVCDGIWKSYADIHGTNEFKPFEGEKTECILFS